MSTKAQRLLSEATPLPWRMETSRILRSGRRTEAVVIGIELSRIGSPTGPLHRESSAYVGGAESDIDAELIVHAVNTLVRRARRPPVLRGGS